MGRVSDRRLSETVEQEIGSFFLDELTRITDKTEMTSLFGKLLTDSEKIMLAKRLVAFAMIEKGMPDTHISKSLHLTRETVYRFRLIYSGAVIQNEPIYSTIKNLTTKDEFKKWLKKFIGEYLLRAMGGRIPRKSIF